MNESCSRHFQTVLVELLPDEMSIQKKGLGRDVNPLDVLQSFLICWKIDHMFDDLPYVVQLRYHTTSCPHQLDMESELLSLSLIVGPKCQKISQIPN